MTASGEVSRPHWHPLQWRSFLHRNCLCTLTGLRRVLGLTGLWPSVHQFSIFFTHSHRTSVPLFKTYEYLTAPPYPAQSHSLNRYAPCWDGTRNPLTCVPENVTLSLTTRTSEHRVLSLRVSSVSVPVAYPSILLSH